MALSLPAGLCGLLLSTFYSGASATPSVDIAYCASVNTASGSSNSSIYQSDGLCYDFCADDYAYALLSGTECWCSDYTPSKSTTVDTSKCDGACAGYPSDWCGGDGLYAYMSLSKAPSGTAGASSSTSKTSTSTSSSSKSTSSTSATVQTVTAAGGVVQTVTVTPSTSSTSTASASASSSSSHKKSVSTGAAVGIAIGVVGAAVLAGVGLFVAWRRRRQQRDQNGVGSGGEALFASSSGNPKTPSPRGTSPNTSNGPEIGEVSTAPAFARRPGGDGQWETDQSGRRRSTLMPIDPRIDPAFSGIYARTDNKSRDSVNSLRDDHDYSRRVHQPNRVLRATNPDPEQE